MHSTNQTNPNKKINTNEHKVVQGMYTTTNALLTNEIPPIVIEI